ncbi:MAG: hypothetical protein K2F83_06360, partial [Oscillospiraceae bacterium]|nr:hypothetical protein [Oscillospiraceae bacterium]
IPHPPGRMGYFYFADIDSKRKRILTANTAVRASQGLLLFISLPPYGFYAGDGQGMPGKSRAGRYIFPSPGHTGKVKKEDGS